MPIPPSSLFCWICVSIFILFYVAKHVIVFLLCATCFFFIYLSFHSYFPPLGTFFNFLFMNNYVGTQTFFPKTPFEKCLVDHSISGASIVTRFPTLEYSTRGNHVINILLSFRFWLHIPFTKEYASHST